MNCPKCGQVIENGTARCPHCDQVIDVMLKKNAANADYCGPLGTSKPAFVWGILACVFACLAVTSPLGIIFGCIGKKKANDFCNYTGSLYGRARVGRMLSQAGFVIGIVMTALGAIGLIVALCMAWL